jgi:predicted DNA-binding transcriptional regulator AlpA
LTNEHQEVPDPLNARLTTRQEAAGGLCITGLAEMPERTLLDERAMASALHVSPRTIRRMVMRGQLPAGIKLGSRRMWLVGKVTEFLSAESDKSAAEARRIAALFMGSGI